MEAIAAIQTTLHHKHRRPWVLDADISGGCDHMDQGPWLATLPVCTATWRRWLQAGVVARGSLSPTDTGTPQGGGSSPRLATVALAGMARWCDAEWPAGRPRAPSHRQGRPRGVTVIRYADDLVGTAPTREGLATQVRPQGDKFLQERGRAFREAKTRLGQSKEGCNCLGFPLRTCGSRGKWLTVPQQEKVLKHLRAMRSSLDAQKPTPAGRVMKERNPVRRGWAHSSRHRTATHVFEQGRQAPWQMRWIGAKRRQPNKSSQWVKARSGRNDGSWTFWEGKATLVKPDATPITRFTKITGQHSPYDPALRPDWVERKKHQVGRETYAQQRLRVPQKQGYQGALCRIPCIPGENRETDHSIPPSQGGTDDMQHTRLVHPWGHRPRHQMDGRQRPRA